MPHRLLVAILLCLGFNGALSAQVLDEVSFSSGTTNLSTYVTDINNAGAVCGYYDSAGKTHGFAINPEGVIRRFITTTAGQSVKVAGINNQGTLLLNSYDGTSYFTYKVYYDSVAATWGSPVQVTSSGLTASSQSVHINNRNDITGWLQGGTLRSGYVLHDSITPPSPATPFLTVTYPGYNTQGAGINDNNLQIGFWYDGTSITPLLCDALTNTYTSVINGLPNARTRPWDINNSNRICGEFRQSNGVFTAFIANISGNTISGTVNLATTIFQNTSIQSVAYGINDKGYVVGAYLHPTTNVWVGFIYRPGVAEYRLPGFSWSKHTWKMDNSQAVNDPIAVWTSAYWGNNNYLQNDPFAPAQDTPVIDYFMKLNVPTLGTDPNISRRCADWLSLAQELDTFENAASSPNYQLWKHFALGKGINAGQFTSFQGICYGFAGTAALHYANDTFLHSLYPAIAAGANLYGVSNSDQGAIRGIVRTSLKQSDKLVLNRYGTHTGYDIGYWEGLFRLKNTCLQTDATKRDPHLIYITIVSGNDTGFHSLMPYKVRTPQKLPFFFNGQWARDTMFVYDCKYPNDSGAYFTLQAGTFATPFDSCKYTRHNFLRNVHFNEVGARQLFTVKHTALKTTGVDDNDTLESVSTGRDNFYSLTSGGQQAYHNASGTGNNIPWLRSGIFKEQTAVVPRYYTMDTLRTVLAQSNNYSAGEMVWSLSQGRRIMGLSRTATVAQSDNGMFRHRTIAFGTHDAATKTLTGYLCEIGATLNEGVNIMASGLQLANGDSIVTENPSRFVYRITRIGGAANSTYNLLVYEAGADSMRQFVVTGITLAPGSTHTITPYTGAHGTGVTVSIDNGNNGTIDSSISLAVTGAVSTGAAQEIRMYPNPVQDRLTVAFAGGAPAGSLRLTDIAGRVVYSSTVTAGTTEAVVPAGGLMPGVYSVSVVGKNGVVVFRGKVVKE